MAEICKSCDVAQSRTIEMAVGRELRARGFSSTRTRRNGVRERRWHAPNSVKGVKTTEALLRLAEERLSEAQEAYRQAEERHRFALGRDADGADLL